MLQVFYVKNTYDMYLPTLADILLLEVLIPWSASGTSQRCFACEHLQNLSMSSSLTYQHS